MGIVVGFAVGVVFTEWIFEFNESWPDALPVVLAVLGGLAGAQLGRHVSARRVDSPPRRGTTSPN
jgi:uncharacterized membrane protein YfcA